MNIFLTSKKNKKYLNNSAWFQTPALPGVSKSPVSRQAQGVRSLRHSPP